VVERIALVSQKEIEKEIFRRFAGCRPCDINPDTIVNSDPPKPDISCKTFKGEELSFELVEILDSHLANQLMRKVSLAALLQKEHAKSKGGARERTLRRFGHSLIHVSFKESCGLKRARSKIPEVYQFISNLSDGASGVINRFPSNLRAVVSKIRILNGSFNGPCFDVEGGGFFSDPVEKNIAKKFSKRYTTSAPIELVAYFAMQYALPSNCWLPQVSKFVESNLARSPFRRVWVFEAKQSAILFSFP